MAYIGEIRRHALKSGRIEQLAAARVLAHGIEYDRGWMAVRPDGQMVNQLGSRHLAGVETEISNGTVEFHSGRGYEPLQREIADTTGCKQTIVTIYNDTCRAMDLGDVASEWMSRELGTYVRLVQVPHETTRMAAYDPEGTTTPIAFQDAGTMLVASTASLADLNARITARGKDGSVPMDRFRPNLVIEGCEPYEEDTWRLVRIRNVFLHFTIPCRRCGITTQDQRTGISAGTEPLRTLAGYRRWKRPGSQSGAKPIFGMNVNHEGTGVLRVGDDIEIIERGEPFVSHGLAS